MTQCLANRDGDNVVKEGFFAHFCLERESSSLFAQALNPLSLCPSPTVLPETVDYLNEQKCRRTLLVFVLSAAPGITFGHIFLVLTR